LSGKVTFVIQNQAEVYDFTDKFVWRDGRWQATGSTVTRRQ
jgi:predicted heme/steroid binding protein